MKPAANSGRSTARAIWVILLLIVLLAVGGFGYRYWNQNTAVKAQGTAASGYTTRQVRTGSITLASSGSVTLVPGQETTLAFTVSGNVASLNVVVGDRVKKGQLLAQLDTIAELEADVKTAEQDLVTSQQELDAFKTRAPANLANAQLTVIAAQETLEEAQSSVVDADMKRCSDAVEKKLYDRYQKAVSDLEALGDGGGHADYYLNVLLPQKQVVDQALGAYKTCSGYTPYQVASTHANLSVAEAELQQAQAALETLEKNNGLDPSGLATAENKVATAELALEDAKDALEGATLEAPFDGTILSVSGKAGDAIEVTTRKKSVGFITIADLAHPVLNFTVDESDLGMISVGETARVTFDAFANRTFTGAVIRVDPTLASSSGTPVVSGQIQLDLRQETDVPDFPKNLSGSVQIIQAEVDDVLLAPVEALLEQSDGTYAVYVAGANGNPVLKTVTIGLQNVASVEIKSGLNANDMVITSTVR